MSPGSIGQLRGQRGIVVSEFVLGIAVLVVPLAVLVAILPTWLEVQSMARVAAQQAARAAVLAPDDDAAVVAARDAAATVVANHGRALVAPVRVDGGVRPAGDGGPQETITATVTVRMPTLALPLLADLGGIDWEVSHTQPVDLYRSVP